MNMEEARHEFLYYHGTDGYPWHMVCHCAGVSSGHIFQETEAGTGDLDAGICIGRYDRSKLLVTFTAGD
jgi:hypothetical protein